MKAVSPSGCAGAHPLSTDPVTIEAHLTIVFARSVSVLIEAQTGRTVRRFFRAARIFRSVEIWARWLTIIAADPIPAALRPGLGSPVEVCALI